MRISNEQAQQILSANTLKGAKGPQAASGAGEVKGASALSVSSAASEISKATAAINQLPDMRADRVAELQAKIADGSYAVSGQDIAESLLRRATDKLL